MRKLLIIRMCGVGDFVLNLPALVALEKVHSNARFTLVGNASTLELARGFVSVDSIYSIDTPPWSRLFQEPLPDLEFDSAVVWMKDPVIADNLRASGIPNVIWKPPFPAFGHAADHLLRTLRVQRPALPDLWNCTNEQILIHDGSGSPAKNWPYFPELRGRLTETRQIPADLPLIELTQKIARCRMFIGNDSGITHLAAYIGCPTVALFGPTDPRTWGPIGRRARVLWKSNLEEISVNEVLLTVHGAHTRT